MRILAITPIAVTEEELARRQARYDRLCPAGVTVHLENIGTDARLPRALETAEDIAASDAALLERYLDADVGSYDVYLPDCILDPVVDHADQLPRPVYGMGRLAAHYLAGFGLRIGAVARNAAIADELDRRLARYGLSAEPTAVLDLAVDAIADDHAWAAAVRREAGKLACQAVINACSAVETGPLEVGATSRRFLLDPAAVALRMLGTFEVVAR